MRVAFLVEKFPAVSETFIIDQVADLRFRGIKVTVFSFQKGDRSQVSQRFQDEKLSKVTTYLNAPKNKLLRYLVAIPKLIRLLSFWPSVLPEVLNVKKYGRDATSLRLIYWANLLLGQKFDLIHCHNGAVANKFLIIREALNLKTKFVTSFYGSDVSRNLKAYGPHLYDRLNQECSLFFVMSENMRDRLIDYGLDQQKLIVHPVGINASNYQFRERMLRNSDPVEIVSVGRFEEKKGFDDLLRALTSVKQKTTKSFHCTIVGDGRLKDSLHKLTDSLNLGDIVRYTGYMKIDKILELFDKMDFFVQPSKTARDGNME